MNKLLVSLLSLSLAIACTSPKTEQDTKNALTADADSAVSINGFREDDLDSYKELDNYIVTASVNSNDLQEIDSTAVVIIDPTEEQITQMEEEYGEEDLAAIADDASYYLSEATLKLDSFKIKTLEASKRFINLKGNRQSWLLDVRKEGAPEWNLILFHKDKIPEILPAIDLTDEKIKTYFNLK
jgi:hypothetical protein